MINVIIFIITLCISLVQLILNKSCIQSFSDIENCFFTILLKINCMALIWYVFLYLFITLCDNLYFIIKFYLTNQNNSQSNSQSKDKLLNEINEIYII